MQPIKAEEEIPGGEAELVRRARARDPAAFRAIMQQHNRRLYRLVRGYVQSADEAEDVVQASWVRAYAALGDFRGEARLSTWLTRIALNEALGRIRNRKDMTSLDDAGTGRDAGGQIIPFPLAQPISEDPEHKAARAEMRLLLERAIDELPVAFRTVFMMRAVEQMSTEEAAACLGIPEETVKTRFHRAKRRLREAINDRLEDAFTDVFPFAGARCERIAERVMTQLGIAEKPPD
jgi:RNA polymerase sigma-70 factor (ECF subfamily)